MPTAASFTRWNMQSTASPGGTRPGWSGPAAVLIAGALTGSGVVVDAVTGGVLGWGLRIGFVVGVTCAVVMVRREGLFTAMVQPPLVFGPLAILGQILTSAHGRSVALLGVVGLFPTLAVGTVLTLALGVLRTVTTHRSGRRPLSGQGRS